MSAAATSWSVGSKTIGSEWSVRAKSGSVGSSTSSGSELLQDGVGCSCFRSGGVGSFAGLSAVGALLVVVDLGLNGRCGLLPELLQVDAARERLPGHHIILHRLFFTACGNHGEVLSRSVL